MRKGFLLYAFAIIHEEGIAFHIRFLVVDHDIAGLQVEDLADLIADQIIDGLHVQLGCQSLLDTGNDRQFGIALFGLFEQALGLVEETRVFEGDAHRVG